MEAVRSKAFKFRFDVKEAVLREQLFLAELGNAAGDVCDGVRRAAVRVRAGRFGGGPDVGAPARGQGQTCDVSHA